MTGGILQIVTKGVDDIFLYGDPQITMFKIVYRRHTNFSKTPIRTNFQSKPKFNSESVVKLRRLADLVHNAYIVIELPEIDLKYQQLTYGKLISIVKDAGINIIDLYQATYNKKINLGERVDEQFYYGVVMPFINKEISKNIALIREIENQKRIINSYISKENESIDISRFLNPLNNKITNKTDIDLDLLPQNYTMYEYLLSTIPIDETTRGAASLYTFLRKYINTPNQNSDKQLLNSAKIEEIIYRTIQRMSNDESNNQSNQSNHNPNTSNDLINNIINQLTQTRNTYGMFYTQPCVYYVDILSNKLTNINDFEITLQPKYSSFIKTHIANFTNKIKRVFEGVNYSFTKYYDTSHTTYLNLSGTNSNQLGSILNNTNIKFSSEELNNKIRLFELIPFIVLYNIQQTLQSQFSININYTKYFEQLVTFYDGYLQSLEDFISENTINDNTNNDIIANIFQQKKPQQIVYTDKLLDIIYDGKQPSEQFILDQLLMNIGTDIIAMKSVTPTTKTELMKVLGQYVDLKLKQPLFTNPDYVKITRLSSVWNRINRNIMELYYHLINTIIRDGPKYINPYQQINPINKQQQNQQNNQNDSNQNEYSQLLEPRISVNKDIFYYNTTADILLRGMQNITIKNNKIIDAKVNQNIPENNKGYMAKLYKQFPSQHKLINDVMTEVLKEINYIIVRDQNNPIDPINFIKSRTPMDIFVDIGNLIDPSMKNYYNYILRKYAIAINNETSYNVITIDDTSNTTNTKIKINESISIGTLYSSIKTNSMIVNRYQSFSYIRNIIRFILDNIVKDLNIYVDDGDDNINLNTINTQNMTSQQLLNKYNLIIDETRRKLNKITSKTNNTTFNGSEIYNRIEALIKGNRSNINAQFAWSRFIGFNLIDYVSITIGDQEIDRHTGTWLYLNYMATRKSSQDYGVSEMVGDLPNLYTYDNKIKRAKLLYIPLYFWFTDNFANSLPLISMQYTEVKINVKIKSLDTVAYWNQQDTYFKKIPKLNGYLLTNIIYLDIDERKQFADIKHEYLINTVQHNGIIINGKDKLEISHDLDPETDENESIISTQRLYFSNMCKELIWIFRFVPTSKSDEEKQERILNWIDFTSFQINKQINKDGREYLYDNIRGFKIEFDGVYRQNWAHPHYYNYVQPYDAKHATFNEGVFNYSFALYPDLLQPSGAADLDIIQYVSIAVGMTKEIAERIINNELHMEWDVYCRSSNILRVFSGMAGLAFYGSYY